MGGDVVVSMKEGYTLNPDFEPEKEGDRILHGDHGGLNFSDSISPFLIAHKGGGGAGKPGVRSRDQGLGS